MPNIQHFLGALALIAAAGIALPAQAAPKRGAAKHLVYGAATDAPTGFREMCSREKRFCQDSAVTPAEPTVVADPALVEFPADRILPWHSAPTAALAKQRLPRDASRSRGDPDPLVSLLRAVNRAVNNSTAQRSDSALYSVDEFWTRSGEGPVAAGDCEDIAIEKRIRLIDAGYPADHLAFAVVYSRRSGLHTVLVARTVTGDVVLDSRTRRVLPWYKAPYRWLGLQSMDDQTSWYAPAA